MRRLWIIPVLVVLAACEVTPDPYPPTPPGAPAVELGYHVGLVYTALQEGDGCPVVWGTQGGYWTMPTLRTQGIAATAKVECWLDAETGERVGYIKTKAKFFAADDAHLEQRQFPIPIYHAAPNEGMPLDDVYGLDGTLGCAITDDAGLGSTRQIAVVITDG